MRDPRKELGRDGLLKKIAECVEKSKSTIRSQVRKMGSSCDWSRERYTFEPALNRLVNEVFVRMHRDGLIYRWHRIVNWDPKLQTTVSDDEIVYVEEQAPFYTFQYGPFQISTSRPETKFGDKYVVMHPNDKRYAKYKHGQTIEDIEWINGKIRATVIKDEAVDPEFGTGVMTITPWHDAADFDIAERHGLEKEQIIGFDGKLLPKTEEFAGMPIEKARPLIVEKLQSKGLLVNTDENYIHNKATSQRGGGVIEPQIKLQWFIDVKKEVVAWKGQKMSLKQVMHDVVHHGDIKIIPDHFEKTYFRWIDNLRDWCISRQIWWGHRVPVWYKAEDVHVGSEMPEKRHGTSEKGQWMQDSDTLDTWFSAALWTWSTLIDPKLTEDPKMTLEDMLTKSPDFRKFHPTSVIETGYDILFFWVERMILMTTYATGQIPFQTVYLHGLIRTREGKKMSKSDPTTMIDPLDMIAKYGADALRLSMIVGQSPGADSRLYEEKIAGYRNFINKLWNASRFVLMKCEEAGATPSQIENEKLKIENCGLADRALLFALQRLIVDVTEGLSTYRLSEVGERIYGFVWDYFCDWYLELSKGSANIPVLVHAMRIILRLLHPYCPFVTEELWGSFKEKKSAALISTAWPESANTHDEYREDFDRLQIVIDVITAIRKLRADHNVTAGKEISVTLVSKKHQKLLEDQSDHIRRMAKVGHLSIAATAVKLANVASVFLKDVEVHVSLEGLIDPAVMKKEHAELVKYVASLESKLGNKAFTEKAPAKIVDDMKAKLLAAKEKLEKMQGRLDP